MKQSEQEQLNDTTLASPWRVFRYATKPYTWSIFWMFLCVLTPHVLLALSFLILKELIDYITVAEQVIQSELWKYLGAIIAIYVLYEILFRIAHIIETIIVPRILDRIISGLYFQLLGRPTSFFEDRFSGELVKRISKIEESVIFFVQEFPWFTLSNFIQLVMIGVLLIFVHEQLLITYSIWLLFFAFVSFLVLRWNNRLVRVRTEKDAQLGGNIVDTVANVPVVHSFASIAHEEKRHRTFMDGLFKAERKERWSFVVNKLNQGWSHALILGALMVMSVDLFIKEEITIGAFVLAITTLPRISNFVWSIGSQMVNSIRHYGELGKSTEELRSEIPGIASGSRELAIKDTTSITFSDITFAYPGVDETLFKHFNLNISAGEKVGIVGTSGAGKSTLIKLLLRQYDPQKGMVRIGGSESNEFTLASLRKNIAFVPQDTTLFHRSLYDNIAYAKDGAEKAAVLAAAKRAHAHEFTLQTPNGYETLVGERGVKLSGGQRQRIALARAILKDAPILVLDEATSALDSESEEIVQEGLYELFQGRTVIAVAHRLSTLRAMDRIVVMEGGNIIEEGAPSELLKKEGGTFKRLWDHQKGGFV